MKPEHVRHRCTTPLQVDATNTTYTENK